MIYFLRHRATGLIKIGSSKRYSRRYERLSRQFGELELLGFVDGSVLDEYALHRKFSSANERDKLNGREWFKPVPELVEFISANASTNFPLPLFARPTRKHTPTFSKTVSLNLALKPLMKKAGVNQDELAEKIGIPQGTISRWANNRVDRYDRRILEKLMVFFDCSLEELFNIRVVDG